MATKPAANGHAELATLQSWAIEAEAAAGIARALAPTAFIPDTLRRWLPANRNETRQLDFDATVATVTAALLTGQELGFRPMASLRVIDVIRQTPALRAVGLRALLLSHGHQILVVESTETRARVRGRRAGTEQWQESVWTIDRAKQLGVYPGPPDGQWRRQPQSMLVARATAEISRWIAADAMLGLPLIAEEIDPAGEPPGLGLTLGGTEAEGGAEAGTEPPAGRPAASKPGATVRRRSAAPRAALPAAPPPSSAEAEADEMHAAAAERHAAAAERHAAAPPAEAAAPPPASGATYPAAADPAEAEPPADAPTKAQRARLHILLKECGMTEREPALAAIGEWIGRTITTTNQLTVAEASTVIDHLTAIARENGGDDNATATE